MGEKMEIHDDVSVFRYCSIWFVLRSGKCVSAKKTTLRGAFCWNEEENGRGRSHAFDWGIHGSHLSRVRLIELK